MMIALAGGFLLIFVGVFFSGPMLGLMGTPDDVLPLAALYLKIYFIGMPATLTYNFGAAILRAVGDTRRPLYFLLFAGAVNVVLNLNRGIRVHFRSTDRAMSGTFRFRIPPVPGKDEDYRV